MNKDMIKGIVKYIRDSWERSGECPPRGYKFNAGKCDSGDMKVCKECFEGWIEEIEK